VFEAIHKFSKNVICLRLTNCHLTSLAGINLLTGLRIIKLAQNHIDFMNPDNHFEFLMFTPFLFELSS
jgi:hypothetical protein